MRTATVVLSAALLLLAAGVEAALIGTTDVFSFTVGQAEQPPAGFRASLGYLGDAASLFGEIPLAPADTGATFSRGPGDDPGFAAIVARLTNGLDEQLAIGFAIGQNSGADFPLESDASTFGSDVGAGSVDLAGFVVDRIDLVSDEVSVVAAGGLFDAALRFHFDVFGTPAVPEPSSLALLVLAAGAIAWRARRPRPR